MSLRSCSPGGDFLSDDDFYSLSSRASSPTQVFDVSESAMDKVNKCFQETIEKLEPLFLDRVEEYLKYYFCVLYMADVDFRPGETEERKKDLKSSFFKGLLVKELTEESIISHIEGVQKTTYFFPDRGCSGCIAAWQRFIKDFSGREGETDELLLKAQEILINFKKENPPSVSEEIYRQRVSDKGFLRVLGTAYRKRYEETSESVERLRDFYQNIRSGDPLPFDPSFSLTDQVLSFGITMVPPDILQMRKDFRERLLEAVVTHVLSFSERGKSEEIKRWEKLLPVDFPEEWKLFIAEPNAEQGEKLKGYLRSAQESFRYWEESWEQGCHRVFQRMEMEELYSQTREEKLSEEETLLVEERIRSEVPLYLFYPSLEMRLRVYDYLFEKAKEKALASMPRFDTESYRKNIAVLSRTISKKRQSLAVDTLLFPDEERALGIEREINEAEKDLEELREEMDDLLDFEKRSGESEAARKAFSEEAFRWMKLTA